MLITARFAAAPDEGARLSRSTLAIAITASVSYVGLVAAARAVVPVLGDAATALSERLIAMVALIMAIALGLGRVRPATGAPVLLLAVQGLLDDGHLLLFAGSHGADPEIAAVAGSCFGAVTTLLGYLILREPVSAQQWGSIAMVFAGVALPVPAWLRLRSTTAGRTSRRPQSRGRRRSALGRPRCRAPGSDPRSERGLAP
jgi:drug/metabolite transporter (DMT)-like permease